MESTREQESEDPGTKQATAWGQELGAQPVAESYSDGQYGRK